MLCWVAMWTLQEEGCLLVLLADCGSLGGEAQSSLELPPASQKRRRVRILPGSVITLQPLAAGTGEAG
jgi:hypothetical protein